MVNSTVMADVFAVALARARLEIDRLNIEKVEIERKIARLTQTVNGLAALVEPPIQMPQRLSESEGLTKTILMVFSLSKEPVTTVQIREMSEELGYVWKTKDNALNVIHAALKRLIEKKEVKKIGEPPDVRYELDIPF
jgi:hypothetical protein